MSIAAPPNANPYSMSTLLGRSIPVTSWRSEPSSPKTATPPLGAATLIVPSTRLRSGAVGWTQMAGSSGSCPSAADARSGLISATGGAAADCEVGAGCDVAEPPDAPPQEAAAHSATAAPGTSNERRTSGVSEVEPEHELHLARRARAVAAVERPGDAAEGGRRADVRGRVCEIHPVDRVERFPPEFDVPRSGDRKTLLQRKVDLQQARAPQNVASGVPPRSA